MDYLLSNCRPSAALTKYIEIIGILNGLAYKNIRSKYKVLLPSNYHDTLCLLERNADSVAAFLADINTADISNELAALIYCKTRENGFNDEKAFEDGGPELREIFSNVSQILTALDGRSSSSCCLPLGGNEILIAVTKDKASYAALDSASHILGLGSLSIVVYVDEFLEGVMSEQTLNFLARDIDRRTLNQYNIPKSNYYLETFVAQGGDQVKRCFEELVSSSNAKIFCIGLTDSIGLDSPSPLLSWAVWECKNDVILTPGYANIRPLNTGQVKWTHLIYIRLNDDENVMNVYQSALKFIRPSDFVIFFVSAGIKASQSSSDDTRFDYGRRLEWCTEPPLKPYPHDSNDIDLNSLVSELKQLLLTSKVEGTVRIEHDKPATTTAQLLRRTAAEEKVDLILIKRNENSQNMIKECAYDISCSICVIK